MLAALRERASQRYRSFLLTQAEKLGLDNRMALAKGINRRRYRDLLAVRIAFLNQPGYLEHIAGVERIVVADGWSAARPSLSFAGHPIIADSQAILREERGVKSQKGFMVNHLTRKDLVTYPSFIEAALHPVVLVTAAAHLGMYPILSSVKLLVSSPDTCGQFSSSQLYHLDHADFPLLKLIINVNDVTADSGPFCFLPASVSKDARRVLGYGRRGTPHRIDDETMYRTVDKGAMVQLTGAAGDAAFVDTSQCFHYGSRNTERERRIVMYSFSTPARSDFRKPNNYSLDQSCEGLLKRALLDPYFKGVNS